MYSILLAALAIANPCPHSHLFKRDVTPFEGLPARVQLENAWSKVVSSRKTSNSFAYNPLKLLVSSLNPSISYASDELPPGRTKTVHSAGAVSKVRFEAVENPYTGLFQGCEDAILRYSLAVEPNKSEFVMGGAIKFFRDNNPSANTFFMNGIKPLTNPNFFTEDYSNHISDKNGGLTARIINWKFSTAPTKYPIFTGVSDIASIESNGTKVAKPVYPFQLLFRPRAAAKWIVDESLMMISDEDAYRSLKALVSIPSDVPLWDVYASASPTSPFSKIGTVISSSFVSLNSYGNDGLFFKHQTWDEDVEPGTFGEIWQEQCIANSCTTCHVDKTCKFQ
jgi:hypothetical protein